MKRIRKLNRLKHYDYSLPGYYFLTINVYNRLKLFGFIVNGKMFLSKSGKIVEKCLTKIHLIYKNTELDCYVIMPNHIHIIIVIKSVGDAKFASPTEDGYDRTKMLLSKIIQQFKRICTIEIKKAGYKEFRWQRSFYDRIIRNEKELYNIRRYINQNSYRWCLNEEKK